MSMSNSDVSQAALIESRYSDHVYISLTLQKLVRPLDLSTIDPKVLSNLGLSSRHQQSSKNPSDHLFRRRTPESDTQSKTSSHGGFVLAQQKGLDHTTPRKLRTLQGYRYRGALNADRIEFMEARSPLTKMDLAVSAEQVSMFLMSGKLAPANQTWILLTSR